MVIEASVREVTLESRKLIFVTMMQTMGDNENKSNSFSVDDVDGADRATVSAAGAPTTKKNQKSVTFSSTSKNKLVPHYKDYTKRQWNQIWYTQDEIDTMTILAEKEKRAEKKKNKKAEKQQERQASTETEAAATTEQGREQPKRQYRDSIITRSSPRPSKEGKDKKSKRSSSLLKTLLGMNLTSSPSSSKGSSSPSKQKRSSIFSALTTSPRGGGRRSSVQSPTKSGGSPPRNKLPPTTGGRRHSTDTRSNASSEGLPPRSNAPSLINAPPLTTLDRYTTT